MWQLGGPHVFERQFTIAYIILKYVQTLAMLLLSLTLFYTPYKRSEYFGYFHTCTSCR
jgi:hypothetical protein